MIDRSNPNAWWPRAKDMPVAFRAALVLMIFGAYSYGDHVTDPSAFALRCRALPALRGKRDVLATVEVPPGCRPEITE